jgi:DNA-directed RNA polymerase specialized sigma24 family protein
MTSTREQLEVRRKAEEKAAKRWYARNEGKLPPSRLPREQADKGRVRTFTNAEYSALRGSELGVVYSEAGRFLPLQGGMPGVDTEERDEARRAYEDAFDAAFDSLPKRQQTLLLAHYIEGLSLAKLAEHGESRQAVHERVYWAKLALRKALTD